MKPEIIRDSRIPIESIEDVIRARHHGSMTAQRLGFCSTRTMIVATAISELARNILRYAVSGEMLIEQRFDGAKKGLLVSAIDNGPGIENLENILGTTFLPANVNGIGLPGVRQMVDEFEIKSDPDKGTQVSVTVWSE